MLTQMLTTVGSIGFGMMWGWLLGLVIGRDPRPWPLRQRIVYATALFLASALLGGIIYLYTDLIQASIFGITAAIFMSIHIGWLIYLRQPNSSEA